MRFANYQLDLLGQTRWWAAVSIAAGVALILYAIFMWRKQAVGKLPLASLLTGIGVLGATPVLMLLDFQVALPLFVLAAVATATVLFYRGVYGSLTRGRRFGLIFLRVGGAAALVLLLFRPVLAIFQGPAATKPLLAVVVDASASMGYNDAANQPNRYRQSVLAVQNTLLPRLGKSYRLELFAYDGKHATPLANPDELDAILPNGEVTDIGAALTAAANASGTIIFSDGIHNGAVGIDAELAQLRGSGGAAQGGGSGGPIHTVRVGSSELEPSSVPDIAVVSIDGPQTAIVNNLVTLTATIKSTAMADRTVRVMLASKDAASGAKPMDEQRLVLRSGGTGGGGAGGQTVQLHFTPDKVGRAVVRVQVPVDPGERSDANNQQDFALLITDPKLTVLYVEGRVRPEVGPLRRTLEQDPNLALVSMVQTVAGRFEMTGLAPNDDLKGLPTTLAQWKRFKVVVLGDLDASFLNTQQQKDLEQSVRDGGSLIMIGGQNSFAPGGWDKTTLAALMPVSLEKLTPSQINAPFVPQLTSVGGGHPIFRNIASYFLTPDGKKAGDTVPELTGCVALGTPKAGATVLAVHPTEKIAGNPATVLAVQQYGKGRTAAFAADTTYRWNLALRALGKDSPYNRFWGQMIRWLAAQDDLQKKTGASVTAMLAKERFESGESVPLRAAVTDKDGAATIYAKTWADITGPDGKTARVDLAAKGSDAGDVGIYLSPASALKPSMAGTYKVVFAASKDNADLGKDETTFFVLPAAGERDVLAAEPRTLQLISDRTGGTSVDIAAVDALADRVLADLPPPPAASVRTQPLSWPRPFFLLFICCLGLEWFLRRRWQLQ